MITADRINAVPASIASTVGSRLLFRLADPLDASQVAVRPSAVESLPDGRAVDVGTGLQVQFAAPAQPLPDMVVALASECDTPAAAIEELPATVPLAAVVDAATFVGVDLFLPLGLEDRRLQPAGWRLGPGDHALVTGPGA